MLVEIPTIDNVSDLLPAPTPPVQSAAGSDPFDAILNGDTGDANDAPFEADERAKPPLDVTQPGNGQLPPPPAEPVPATAIDTGPPLAAEQPQPLTPAGALARLAEIRKQDEVCRMAMDAWTDAQSEVKEAKENEKDAEKAYLRETAKLHEMIRAEENDQDRPLLDQMEEKQDQPADSKLDSDFGVLPPAEPIDTSEPEAEAADSADWQSQSIEVLGLGPMTKIFQDAGITTVGLLEERRGKEGGLGAIKGIGKRKIEKVTEALLAFLPFGDLKPSANGHAAAVESELQSDYFAARIAELRQAEDMLFRDSQDAWNNGATAASDKQPVEACPYPPGPKQDDWLRGWSVQSSIGSQKQKQDDFATL